MAGGRAVGPPGEADGCSVRFDSLRADGRSLEFAGLQKVVSARTIQDVVPALAEVEREVAAGAHAAGFLAFEAAPAFDAALTTRPGDPDLPLLWFGIFAERRPASALRDGSTSEPLGLGEWESSLSFEPYADRVDAIRELIAAGDTYQVNFTFPLSAGFSGDEMRLYEHLCQSQRAGFCALMRLPGATIASASPELFFRWQGSEIEMRPMKGTRPRGRWPAEDERRVAELLGSEKERAENIMIVDLLRNDAGRIAEYGSVIADPIFEVESYPTVHQLTSTVRARTRPHTTLTDIFRAIFPSGSITGAPKVRTMQIIRELEEEPRGVYTGAIGFFSPGEAVFNVPIRTLVIDRQKKTVRMGVGSGVTYDSVAEAEYRECLQKSAFTHHPVREFELLETMRYRPSDGVYLLEDHLARLAGSARYFDIPIDLEEIRRLVSDRATGPSPLRIRLLVSRSGASSIEAMLLEIRTTPLRAAVCSRPLDSDDVFLYHKTTWRAPLLERLAEHTGVDEVILTNERGELSELVNGNLVVRKAGRLLTPPIESGLLAGTLRGVLLTEGTLEERVLFPSDLADAEAIHRINSVQGWTQVVLS